MTSIAIAIAGLRVQGRLAGVLFCCLCTVGCDQRERHSAESPSQPRAIAEPKQLPAALSVSGADMTSGFVAGELREQHSVPSFRITRHPITWAQFDECVTAGACSAPRAQECSDEAYSPFSGYAVPDYREGWGESPATCVGREQAAAYCGWVGGHLPALDQWLLAARGESPRRFSWGDAATNCKQHPLAGQLIARIRGATAGDEPAESACENDGTDDLEFVIGDHRAGASPSGMQDVLLAPGELVATDPGSMLNACGTNFAGCVVYGMEPAAIDSVEPYYDVSKDSQVSASVAHAYAFRCAWEGMEP